MEFVIVWVGLAIVCAIVAPTRGRSAIGWFCLAFFISGLLAIILLLALPSKKAPAVTEVKIVTDRPRGGNDEKTCPRCAETIKRAAKVCRFCGYDYAESAWDEIKASPAQYLGTNYIVNFDKSVSGIFNGEVRTWHSIIAFKAEIDAAASQKSN
ncbi:MAG: zinc ribbon domain-containing protein [Pseudomonadota bacterium]